MAAVCVGRGVGGVTQYRQHCDDDVVTAVVTTSKIGGVVWVVFSQFSPDSRILRREIISVSKNISYLLCVISAKLGSKTTRRPLAPLA